jgi:HSP20 family protein
VIEDENKYCIEIAAPGMSKDDFKVHVNKDGNLVIEMEKKEKDEKKECEDGKCCDAKNIRYIRREFSCTKFRQTLLLPENAERDEIKARAENGILHICIPKMVKPKTEEEKREIEIH